MMMDRQVLFSSGMSFGIDTGHELILDSRGMLRETTVWLRYVNDAC